ncbi:ABC transporter permease [Kytococcus schroeteri]|uniref:ABC transporter permease n=1 Tax=Kytococcus schroeteri TaxID=138300 RepID=UPI0035E7B418
MSTPDRTDPAAAPRSVIHDLGYRGYDGPRAGRLGTLGYLVRQGYASAFGIGRTWKGKVMPWLCLALMCAPMLITGAVMVIFGGLAEEPIFHPARVPYAFATLVALFAAVASPVLFSADLRSRAIVHYLSRPLSRTDYVLSRLGALVLALFTLQAVGILVGTLGWWLGGGDAGTVWGAALVGGLGALLVSVAVGTLAGLVAALTPRRGVATAVILGVLLVLSAVVSVVNEAVTSMGSQHGLLARWASLLSPNTAVERVMAWLTGNEELTPALDDATAAGYLAVLVLACALGIMGLVARYRRVN